MHEHNANRNRNRIAMAVVIAALSVPMIVGLSACSSSSGNSLGATGTITQAAAVVNGQNIAETTVTDYIQDYRTSNNLTDDSAWAQWMVDNNYSAEQLRSDSINYYIQQAVISQDADKRGVSVSDSDIDDQVNKIKDYYGYSDDDWEQQLSQVGYTSDSYRDYVKNSLLQQKLMEATSDGNNSQASDADVLSMANSYASSFNGSKQLKCIVFTDSSKAQDISKQISSGALSFDAAQAQNSTSSDYDGWDCLVNVDAAVSAAVKDMSKGQISQPIAGTTASGNTYIVEVVDVLNVPDGGFTATSQIPTDIYTELQRSASSSAQYTAFETYVQNLVDSADKTINDMPKGLPYDISTDGLTPSNTNNTSANSSNASAQPENGNTSAGQK